MWIFNYYCMTKFDLKNYGDRGVENVCRTFYYQSWNLFCNKSGCWRLRKVQVLQKVERSCTFCSKPGSCCAFYRPKANLFCSKWYKCFSPFPSPTSIQVFLLLLQFLCNNSIEMRAAQATNQNQPYLLIGHKIVLIYIFTCSVSLSYSTKINLFNAEFTRAWPVRYIWSLRLAIASKYKCSDADPVPWSQRFFLIFLRERDQQQAAKRRQRVA